MKKLFLAVALFGAALVANATTNTWAFNQSADIVTGSATVSGFTLGTVTSGTSTLYDIPASTTGTLVTAEWPAITFGYTSGSSAKTGILQFKNGTGLVANGGGVSFTITGLTSGDEVYMMAAAKGTSLPVVTVTGGTQTTTPTYVAKVSGGTYTYVMSTFTATASTMVLTETTNGILVQKLSQNVSLAGIKDAISSDLLKKAGDALVNPTALSVEVYSVTGVKALTSNKTSINISELPQGVYVAKTAKGTLKFIK